MNKRVKKLWLKELRDTKRPWKQGHGQLMNDKDEACCLGVLCDIAVREGVVEPWICSKFCSKFGIRDFGIFDYNGEVETSVLPLTVAKWAGLNATDPLINGRSLSSYNDGGLGVSPCSFAEIADLIEEHL